MPSLRDLLERSDPMSPQQRAQAVRLGIMAPSDFYHGPASAEAPQRAVPPGAGGVSPAGPAQPQAGPVPEQVRQLAAAYAQRYPADVALRMAWDAYRRSQVRYGR